MKTTTVTNIESAEEFARLNGVVEEETKKPKSQVLIPGINQVDVLGYVYDTDDDTLVIALEASENVVAAVDQWVEDFATDEEIGERMIKIVKYGADGQPVVGTTYFGCIPVRTEAATLRDRFALVLKIEYMDFEDDDYSLKQAADVEADDAAEEIIVPQSLTEAFGNVMLRVVALQTLVDQMIATGVEAGRIAKFVGDSKTFMGLEDAIESYNDLWFDTLPQDDEETVTAIPDADLLKEEPAVPQSGDDFSAKAVRTGEQEFTLQIVPESEVLKEAAEYLTKTLGTEVRASEVMLALPITVETLRKNLDETQNNFDTYIACLRELVARLFGEQFVEGKLTGAAIYEVLSTHPNAKTDGSVMAYSDAAILGNGMAVLVVDLTN